MESSAAATPRLRPRTGESVADRSTLVAPRKMVVPVVWLTSPAADGVTGIRIIGNDWDADASAADNLAKCARAGRKK